MTNKTPRSKTGNHQQAVNKEALGKAIVAVTAAGDQKISLREACCVYGVKLSTLKKVPRRLISSKSEDDDLQKQTDIIHSDESECDMEAKDVLLADLEENKEMVISGLQVGEHVLVKCSGKKTQAYYAAQIIAK
ncbi:hypothetical protein QE152_g27163 [Popillia japonica]|uniref:HTH psq-type domain-containing protein n=1 Tax=Popillia japonica TaxID=7064 RepID=A0AAW1JUB2_POPJA